MSDPSDNRPFSDTFVMDPVALQSASEAGDSMLTDEQAVQLPNDPNSQERQKKVERLEIAPVITDERYDMVDWIASGAMGEVLRVRDRHLNCYLAMKVIRQELVSRRGLVARFIEEAQVTAQLDHAGICPVHEIGRLADGRWYYTMKEVKAKPLNVPIRAVHEASTQGQWRETTEGWTFRKLIEVFRKVCEAVGYAHTRQVIHRDLKPENVVCGSHGEVLVVDWGLAKVLGRAGSDMEAQDSSVVTDRSSNKAMATRMGAVAGTPSYMSPEQARGEIDSIKQASDVYSLGTILYEILSGHPPFEGESGPEIIEQVLAGPPSAPPSPRPLDVKNVQFFMLQQEALGSSAAYTPPPVPEELVEICLRAMSREIPARHQNARALGEHIGGWLDGSSKRSQALLIVQQADALIPEIREIQREASRMRTQASALEEAIEPHEPENRKYEVWELQDNAASLEQQAQLKDLEIFDHLQAALTHAPDLKAAHDALARRFLHQHKQAIARRDHTAAIMAETHLRSHDDGVHTEYLEGTGTLSVMTEPTGAEIVLFEYREENRRLVPVKVRPLGVSPIKDLTLPAGSYLLEIRRKGCVNVNYPVLIERLKHWDCRPSPNEPPIAVRLPYTDEISTDDVYVPGGWFSSGGDQQAPESLAPGRVWVDSFIMKRFPVSNRDYLFFLNDLVMNGRAEEAEHHVPREEKGDYSYYSRDRAGKYMLQKDKAGNLLRPDWPVLMISWDDAMAYALWLSDRSGLHWRLPCELEWEKAARGVDNRFFPWGDFFEHSWACARDSHPGRPQLSVIHRFPLDESPYGFRHLGGNASDWCLDAYTRLGPEIEDDRLIITTPDIDSDLPLRTARGGHWRGIGVQARSANRQALVSSTRRVEVSFRVARPYNAAKS